MLRTLMIVLLAAGVAAPLGAKDKNKGKGKGKGKDTRVVFVDRDREIVHTYYVDTYGRGGCPPGLAKKNNGCLPPGQAKKRYVIGQRLPTTIVYQPAPVYLVERLTPVPVGHQYVVLDGDVLLLASGTRLVVDAIRHLVN